MVKSDKILERMQNNPRDWRIEELYKVASKYGFEKVEGKGSHTKFFHKELPEILSIPAKRPVKPIYVLKLLSLIEKLEELE